MRKRSLLMISALLIAVPVKSFSASFDCKKASSKHEKMICGAPQLDAADTQMGEAYKAAVTAFPVKGFLQIDQRNWIRSYQRCEIAEKCIKQAKDRTVELNAYTKSSVFTDSKESKFEADAAMLIFYDRDSKQFVRLFGNWMPDGFMGPIKIRRN